MVVRTITLIIFATAALAAGAMLWHTDDTPDLLVVAPISSATDAETTPATASPTAHVVLAGIDSQVSATKAKLPVEMGRFVHLIDVERDGLTLSANYRIDLYEHQANRYRAFHEEQEARLTSILCTDPAHAPVIRYGLTFDFNFFDKDASYIDTIRVDAQSCSTY